MQHILIALFFFWFFYNFLFLICTFHVLKIIHVTNLHQLGDFLILVIPKLPPFIMAQTLSFNFLYTTWIWDLHLKCSKCQEHNSLVKFQTINQFPLFQHACHLPHQWLHFCFFLKGFPVANVILPAFLCWLLILCDSQIVGSFKIPEDVFGWLLFLRRAK